MDARRTESVGAFSAETLSMVLVPVIHAYIHTHTYIHACMHTYIHCGVMVATI